MITLRNAVLKTDKDLLKGMIKTLKEEGPLSVLAKAAEFLSGAVRTFFREYIPLKILYMTSKKGEITKKIQGSRMVLDLNDLGISRELALYGCHERNSTDFLKSILIPGMKVLEAGANIGYYVLVEAGGIGEKGYIYAFEPSPFNYALLERNIKLNGYINIGLNRTALGAENGKADFFVSNRSNLSGFMRRTDMGPMYDEQIVKTDVIRLDEFLKDKAVDLIRMDVEGFEDKILEGAENTFSGLNAPEYLFIEVHSELLGRKGSSAADIIGYLEKRGYAVVKSFYRGRKDISVDSTAALLAHPYLEKGYWETFFRHAGK